MTCSGRPPCHPPCISTTLGDHGPALVVSGLAVADSTGAAPAQGQSQGQALLLRAIRRAALDHGLQLATAQSAGESRRRPSESASAEASRVGTTSARSRPCLYTP